MFTAINPWHCAIIITKIILGMKPLPSFVRWMCVIMVAVCHYGGCVSLWWMCVIMVAVCHYGGCVSLWWMCVIMVAVPFTVTSLSKRHCAYGQVT